MELAVVRESNLAECPECGVVISTVRGALLKHRKQHGTFVPTLREKSEARYRARKAGEAIPEWAWTGWESPAWYGTDKYEGGEAPKSVAASELPTPIRPRGAAARALRLETAVRAIWPGGIPPTSHALSLVREIQSIIEEES